MAMLCPLERTCFVSSSPIKSLLPMLLASVQPSNYPTQNQSNGNTLRQSRRLLFGCSPLRGTGGGDRKYFRKKERLEMGKPNSLQPFVLAALPAYRSVPLFGYWQRYAKYLEYPNLLPTFVGAPFGWKYSPLYFVPKCGLSDKPKEEGFRPL